MSVSTFPTRSPTGMPLARKSRIFGLHSLFLRCRAKNLLGTSFFCRPRRHKRPPFIRCRRQSVVMLRQRNTGVLEKPLIKWFFTYKVFFRRAGIGKTKKRRYRRKKNFRFINRLIIFRCRGRRALPCRDRHASRSPARSIR